MYYGDLIQEEPRYYHGVIFTKDKKKVGFLAYSGGILYINKNIFDEIRDVFSLTYVELTKVIATWFFNNHGETETIKHVYLVSSDTYDIWHTEKED